MVLYLYQSSQHSSILCGCSMSNGWQPHCVVAEEDTTGWSPAMWEDFYAHCRELERDILAGKHGDLLLGGRILPVLKPRQAEAQPWQAEGQPAPRHPLEEGSASRKRKAARAPVCSHEFLQSIATCLLPVRSIFCSQPAKVKLR